LRVASVLAHVLVPQVRLVEDLPLPLFDGRNAGGQDQRRLPNEGHGGKADDRLARAARQHDDSAATFHVAAGVKNVGRLPLVPTEGEGQPAAGRVQKFRRECGPLDVPGQVLGRVADLDEGELQHAAVGRVDGEARGVELVPEVAADLRLAGQLFEEGLVVAAKSQVARVEAVELDAAVAR